MSHMPKRKMSLKQLTKRAHEYGRQVARHANEGVGYDREWLEVPHATKEGFYAMVKFVLENRRKLSK